MPLPDLSFLAIGAPATPASVGPPNWSAAYTKQFLDNVHTALALDGFDLPRNDKLYLHTAQYLTATFTPHPDLSDQQKNAVLWSTAMFIEGVLASNGLSGGFWVGTMRFANNNVENLRDHRPAAFLIFQRTAATIVAILDKPGRSPVNRVKTAKPKPSVAFLYVVVNKLGFLKKEVPKRHLLLIGHTQSKGGSRHWGVPGGLRDQTDPSSLSNAMREFGEEFLGMKRPDKRAVNGLIERANSIGKLVQLKKNGTYTAWMLVVESALKFEMGFKLPQMTLAEKYYAKLSDETQGYLYVPLPLETTRKSATDPWMVAAPAALRGRPMGLILREGVYNSARGL